MDTDSLPLTDDEAPALRRGLELPIAERVRALAESLDCVLEEDVCVLAKAKPSTPKAWAKRGEGPDYVMFGNRRLYPREALPRFLKDRQREPKATARSML